MKPPISDATQAANRQRSINFRCKKFKNIKNSIQKIKMQAANIKFTIKQVNFFLNNFEVICKNSTIETIPKTIKQYTEIKS